jgi:hypothetical protein
MYNRGHPKVNDSLRKFPYFSVRLNQAVFIGVRAAGVTILIIKSCNNKNETEK